MELVVLQVYVPSEERYEVLVVQGSKRAVQEVLGEADEEVYGLTQVLELLAGAGLQVLEVPQMQWSYEDGLLD